MRLLPYKPYEAVSPVENVDWKDPHKPTIYCGIVVPVDLTTLPPLRAIYLEMVRSEKP
jgi:hypothetical protein